MCNSIIKCAYIGVISAVFNLFQLISQFYSVRKILAQVDCCVELWICDIYTYTLLTTAVFP